MQKKELIEQILVSPSPLIIFQENYNNLKGTRFLLFDNNLNTFGKKFQKINFNNFTISPLAEYQNTIVLDQYTVKESRKLEIVHCVDFDSNIISNLRKLFFHTNYSNEDLTKLLLYIKKERIQPNCSPYLIECAANNFTLDKEDVYESLLSFSLLENINIEQLLSNHLNKYPLSINYLETDERWRSLIELKKYANKEYIPKYHYIYCLLLKMYFLKFSSKKSSKNKLIQLLDSINTELFGYWENELAICYLSLKEDSKTASFFGSVQPNTKDMLNKIQGMAWDLFHLRCAQEHMAMRNSCSNQIFLHSFGSEDKGINSIIRLNPIKRIAFDGMDVYTHHKYTIFNMCPEVDVYTILNKHKDFRNKMCKKTNYQTLSKKLEYELLQLS